MPGPATPGDEDPSDIIVEEPNADGDERRVRALGWTGWLISGSLHLLLMLIMYGIYWVVQEPETDTPPVRIATIDTPEKPPEREKLERTLDQPVDITVEAESTTPAPISSLDLPVEVAEREEEQEDAQPKGREEAVADSETGGSGAFMAVGAGGGSAGMFGSRVGGGKKRAVGRFGGNRASENAVDAALRWFKKHQSPDGGWDHVNYFRNCTEAPKCEPGGGAYGDHVGVAMTGYAVLCFLGAGYDHQTPNKYKAVVKRGLDHLVAIQPASGFYAGRNYENGIAAMALAEAYAMTGDPALKGPAQRCIDAVVQQQNSAGEAKKKTEGYGNGMGWDYRGPTMRNDSSVTGWNVMALKSAVAAQLNVGTAMEGSRQWLETTWKATNPDWATLDPYSGESKFPYSYLTDKAKPEGHLNMACVGAVCAVFLGKQAGDPMLETLANSIDKHQRPTRYPCNTYYMYYNTLAIFQVGGARWQSWNAAVRDMLVGAQRKEEGCFDGSWDFVGTNFHGHDVGRVLSTAYCCLSLEVYYRYAQIGAKQ